MDLDLQRFYQACNPSRALAISDPQDRKYYVDFSSARGGRVIDELERTITRLSPNEPTCQLFTGHIGCGKSTELLRLRYDLQQKGFHVVYFESSQDLVMADVDVTDILLAVARQISDSLDATTVRLQPNRFLGILQGAINMLQTEIDVSADISLPGLGEVSASAEEGLSIGFGIGKITAKARHSPEVRSRLRQYLESRTDSLLEEINRELIEPAIQQLKQQGKQGLAIVVDNLDRVDSSPKPSGRTQPEYLFVDRGEQLKQLKCHVVYTVPLVLTFSNDLGRLRNRFGIDPKVLPMVRLKNRDGSIFKPGLSLLWDMVLMRAFPDSTPQEHKILVRELFDTIDTLDRLCAVSGGHVRNLLSLLYSCLQKEDPPFTRPCLEEVIRRYRDSLVRGITDEEWALLRQVHQQQKVKGEVECQTLLRSMFVYEYQDEVGGWFCVNPALLEAPQLQL